MSSDDLQNLVFVKNIPEDAVESKLIEMLPGAIHVIFGHKPDNTRRKFVYSCSGVCDCVFTHVLLCVSVWVGVGWCG